MRFWENPLPPARSWCSLAERFDFLSRVQGRGICGSHRKPYALPCQSQISLRCLSVPHDDPTMQRLEDQIQWYDSRSINNQWKFNVLKTIVIVAAALIPFLVGLKLPLDGENLSQWIVGGLGVLVTVLEGLQQLNQYHANWISYRFTCEALKHEKFLFLAKAGPYAVAKNPSALLSEKTETLVSQEHAKWTTSQAEQNKKSDETASTTGS